MCVNPHTQKKEGRKVVYMRPENTASAANNRTFFFSDVDPLIVYAIGN